jgi:peptidoglycan/LPS O-acetylase OafA/YrhL
MSSSPSSPHRIPSLDGLRAFSLLLVLLSHLVGTDNFLLERGTLAEYGDFGYLGVRVFFVISGFLITSLLLDEHRRSETISLKGFYIRRAFRIFPAFYVYLLAVVVLEAAGQVHLRDGDVLHAATYTTNYHYARSWHLGHIWSLSVEEQFYLLWPLVFLLCKPRKALIVAAVVVALGPLLRVAAWFGASAWRDEIIFEAFPTVADALATGCLLAGARMWLWERAWWRRFLGSPAFWLVPVAVAVCNLPHRVSFDFTIGVSLMNFGIAVTIERFVRFPDTWSGVVLNWRPIAWFGTLSYSLYLWQEIFLNPHSSHPFAAFPINLLMALAIAIASHYLIEQPALRFRARHRIGS